MLDYISVADAIDRPGLRLVLTPGGPAPWAEAAKQIFAIKGIAYTPVAQIVGGRDPLLREWTGQESAPAAMYEGERPRTRWDEILLLAERLSPMPRLIPENERERAEMFGLAHAICGEDGFGWCFRRYFLEVQTRAHANGADPATLMPADMLANMRLRYGDDGDRVGQEKARMASILAELARRLSESKARGGRYFLGDKLTALDIYWTTFSNLVAPMAADICPMPEGFRQMATMAGALLDGLIDAALVAHRDTIATEYFRLPMRF